MSTLAWLNSEYWSFPSIAKNQTHALYFDIRCWNRSKIAQFFADLKYGDYEAYELAIRRFPQYKVLNPKTIRINNAKAERRYLQWLHKYTPEWCE